MVLISAVWRCSSASRTAGLAIVAVFLTTRASYAVAVSFSRTFEEERSHVEEAFPAAWSDSHASNFSTWPDPNTPPKWPSSFHVQFQEILKQNGVTVSQNSGAWYYDFDQLTARFDHNKGQTNNFCQGQGLSPKDPNAGCQLLFTKSGDLWVIYPGVQSCCRLCGTAEGCTVLKPDWLTDSKFVGTMAISDRPCAGWSIKGAVAADDTWYVDQKGVPCRYHEDIGPYAHNLTFVASSFSTLPIPPSDFQVPSYCRETCLHPSPPS